MFAEWLHSIFRFHPTRSGTNGTISITALTSYTTETEPSTKTTVFVSSFKSTSTASGPSVSLILRSFSRSVMTKPIARTVIPISTTSPASIITSINSIPSTFAILFTLSSTTTTLSLPSVAFIQPPTNQDTSASQSEIPLIPILVVCLVTASILLIVTFWKRRKEKYVAEVALKEDVGLPTLRYPSVKSVKSEASYIGDLPALKYPDPVLVTNAQPNRMDSHSTRIDIADSAESADTRFPVASDPQSLLQDLLTSEDSSSSRRSLTSESNESFYSALSERGKRWSEIERG